MSNYSDALAGLRDQLANNITNLKAFDYPPDSVNQFPAAIVMPSEIDYEIAFAGNTFTTNVSVWLLVASGDDAIGFRRLYDHLDPTAASQSIKAAIEADRTLGGNVDTSRLAMARNIGAPEYFGGRYFAAEFVIEICVSVA